LFYTAVLWYYDFLLLNCTDQLKGKNVVITGASEGIGEQIAYLYARLGARILITSRTEANLKKVCQILSIYYYSSITKQLVQYL